MKWRTVRILCGISLVLVAVAMLVLFASHGQALAMRVARVTLRGALLPLLAAAWVAIQLRRVEWKDRPLDARQLQFAAAWTPILFVAAAVAVAMLFL